jgi:hypothetical protein
MRTSGTKAELMSWLDRAGAFIKEARALTRREAAARALDDARRRAAALDRPLRAVLLGGTGVGKSSLINAIAGRPLSEVSRRRPTTTAPVAWVHEDHSAEAADFAPGMRAETHREEPLRHLVLADLPDFDSRVTAHRALVDELLPRSDQVLWVVDPDKYNDGLLHREYLSREARLRERFTVVFNKTDALSPAELQLCRDDLAATLRGDGVAAPAVYAVSALRGHDDPGFAEFDRYLRTRFDEKYVRELKATNVLRFLTGAAQEVSDDLGLPSRLEALRAEEAALSGRQEEFLRWLRLQLGPDLFTPELVRGIRDRFRDRFASLLSGPVGMMAEWRLRRSAAKEWRELAGLIRAEAGAAAGQKVFARLYNDWQDTAAWWRRMPPELRPGAPPDEREFGKNRDEALLRLEEALSLEHEGTEWKGRGKVAQHVLPATMFGGCGTATAAFAAELAAAGALAGMLTATAGLPVLLYGIEGLLARRDVARAAREVAERASGHFRTSMEAIYRRAVTVPLMDAMARLREEYTAWRALSAELAGLVR